MATTATILAERYRELGFRVIEGGKSNKLVVVDSLRLAEKFTRRHDNVLQAIDKACKEIESRALTLRHQIPTHFRESTYTDKRGKPWRYYLLTEIGFQFCASGWDPVLRFEILLAFAELQEELGLRAQSIVRPVVDRLQELRGDWTQPELPLASKPQSELPLVEDDDVDDAQARSIWIDGGKTDPRPWPREEIWLEPEHVAMLRRDQDGHPFVLSIKHVRGRTADCDMWQGFLPLEPQALLRCEKSVPDGVLEHILRLKGMWTPLVKKTLDDWFR